MTAIEERTTRTVSLDAPDARRSASAGAKAAHLARAAHAGLPVLPGFVIPYGSDSDAPAVHRAWRELSADGAHALVVRSSSAHEDTQDSSMAGQFTSVLDVRGWEAFRAAVRTVLGSARRPGGDPPAPMAVLVQRMLPATAGGVLFGADPVEGRDDRMLVSAVRGGPDALVSGEQSGTDHHLTRHGRLLRTEPPEPDADLVLGRAELHRLARLARHARQLFGSPQDIEFAFDGDGKLWLLQSRPITAMAARPPRGARLLGPGPVAETLPDALQPLEEDLWVLPMSRGLAAALDIGATVPRRRLRALPVVRTIGGRVAADLELLGAVPPRHRFLHLVNPLPGARRLAAAWRVGRLHSVLPQLALDLLADVDRRLAETGPPRELDRAELIALLRWARGALVALHAQEALAGALLGDARGATSAGVALSALADGRERGLTDAQIIASSPVVLALAPPSVTTPPRLPRDTSSATGGSSGYGAGVASLPVREALRLRVRWVQELQARLVRETARRLAARGALAEPERVALLRWPELITALRHGPLPGDLGERLARTASAPLPDAFRLADGGVVVPERSAHHRIGAGQGVSAGRVTGTSWDGGGTRPPDAVLVVRTLDPALAPLLPAVTGLVAQTGSPLSHLAVLAREFRLPAVVGVGDAVRRFPPGTRLTLDGTTGEVSAESGSGCPGGQEREVDR
ncbi:PEP/pyruvate-binding domain-containing protein [Streptomyces sp. XD-27]|uniref:PEP/pyruvate-binding domain-containing protein n=1 Tax=Streptomyces sp. XD-27 TaxID=3062779 RepID=UPI0026F414DD|nr:PEP/pyruvate-binding domain-containing protein [Streptomyces sp. XD-27]WKX70416.1 PEP/pyruvate-binding domain-containing protein [Streptomyces sp. XD-27]